MAQPSITGQAKGTGETSQQRIRSEDSFTLLGTPLSPLDDRQEHLYFLENHMTKLLDNFKQLATDMTNSGGLSQT